MTGQFITPTTTNPAESHVHRNWQDRPIVKPLDPSAKQTNWTCRICKNKTQGVTYTRATRYISILEDNYNLELWKLRGVAEGLALRNDLLVSASAAVSMSDEDGKKDKLNQICEEAREASGQNQRRELGTAVHALTEQIDRGEDPPIPPSTRKDIEAYVNIMKPFEIVEIERFLVLDELGVGGTTDRIVKYRGRYYIADIKTGSSVIGHGESKIAMQLAMYARSQRYDPDTGQRIPQNVDLTRGLVIHLPAGEGNASLYWADLESAWRGIEVARQVWEWRSMRGLLKASEPIDLQGLIELAGDAHGLRQLWEQHVDIWTDDLTELAQRRIRELQSV